MRRFARPLVLAGLGLSALPASAFAHAHLKGATPAVGSTVATAPAELDLRFSEGLNLRFSGVRLTGPDKGVVTTGDAALAPGDDATLVVPISGSLAAGSYAVAWHALSRDGHKTNGTYMFTIRP